MNIFVLICKHFCNEVYKIWYVHFEWIDTSLEITGLVNGIYYILYEYDNEESF